MFKPIYRCIDCDEYCHRICYKENIINPAENNCNVMMGIIKKNTNQDIDKSVDDEDRLIMTKHCSKETAIGGFVQPVTVVYPSFIQKRCTINRVLEALHKLFPEVMYPPYNGFFFGNSNNTIIH
ncbi:unnamed protein product [Macrosiphum euphorbiae]|uniref:Phorbol-ester/DAG-type domain-containing protein n=1 Tax=Macrosiphum euphorbiae TaxID=13131 RepID=A0AAV0VFS2_9HEMI|nr:unnamed protein product [Macrosiphum euphorbiae]